MGKWEKEKHGMEVLRSIAENCMKKNDRLKERVWKEDLESWGMFADNPNDVDTFLLWCCICPGDRIAMSSLYDESFSVYTVINVWKENGEKGNLWFMRTIDSSLQISDLQINERSLFDSARKMSF